MMMAAVVEPLAMGGGGCDVGSSKCGGGGSNHDG